MRIALGVGSPISKRHIVARVGSDAQRFITIVHPTVRLCRWLEIGPGTAIAAGTMLTVNIQIGAFVTVNRVCNISYDCRVGDFATIAPATNLSGAVEVGAGCDIGSGVTTIEGVRVGDWTIVGAGGVIATTYRPTARQWASPLGRSNIARAAGNSRRELAPYRR